MKGFPSTSGVIRGLVAGRGGAVRAMLHSRPPSPGPLRLAGYAPGAALLAPGLMPGLGLLGASTVVAAALYVAGRGTGARLDGSGLSLAWQPAAAELWSLAGTSVSLAGWLLLSSVLAMLVSFRLPATFRRLSSARTDSGSLMALYLAGFFAAWLTFGIGACLAAGGVIELVAGRPWAGVDSHALVAIVAAAAFLGLVARIPAQQAFVRGIPLQFIVRRWDSGHPWRSAFAIGWAHALDCLARCWTALLLLAVAVGCGFGGFLGLLIAGAATALVSDRRAQPAA